MTKAKIRGTLKSLYYLNLLDVLNEPIEDLGISFKATLEQHKLKILAMHYGLEEDDYRGISLALAREFLKGFQVKKLRGADKKWTPAILGILFVEVERERKKNSEKKDKLISACTKVAKQSHWASILSKKEGKNISNDPGEAIRKAYYKAKKSEFSQLYWDIYCRHVASKPVDEWEKIVIERIQKLKK